MKLINIKLTNFKKLSNQQDPTITFRDGITVLVGANNAGKTSILKAIQRLFKTVNIDPLKDLNYLIDDGSLIIEADILLTREQWKSFLKLALGLFPKMPANAVNIQELSEKLYVHPINVKMVTSFINRRQSNSQMAVNINQEIFQSLAVDDNHKQVISHAMHQFGSSNSFNVYNTPLYLDSKGEIKEQETFVPLGQLKKQGRNGNKANIRGLLYSLKKEESILFEEFKTRLLEIFSELQDIDVRNNEELGIFELVLSEKLKRNGDSKQVDYDIKNVGQGMQTLVLMLANILLLKPSIVLMDEPEVHMHPSLIKEFVKYLKQLSKETQFIITTHSVVLMNEVGLEKLISLKYEVEQKGVIATPVDDRNKLLDAVNSLGYNVDSLTYTLKPKVFVFTEGPSDKDLILAFASRKGLSHDINAFTIGFISMEGKGNRYKLAGLIDKMNKEFIDAPLIMILDKDETPPEQVEGIRNKFFGANPRRLHYLSKRQIENYLLDEKAIRKYVESRITNEKLKQKWGTINIGHKFLEFAELQKDDLTNKYLSEIFIGDSLINTQSIREIIKALSIRPLTESVREFKGEMAKLIAMRTDDLGQKTTSAIKEFEEKWNDPTIKLEMVDGRELLTAFNRWIQPEFNVSFSNSDIINEMEVIPEEIDSLIEQLKKPEELKIKST